MVDEVNKVREIAYDKIFEIMQIILNETNLKKYDNLDSIGYRVKCFSSIKEKMSKVGPNIMDVYDLIGIRYVFTTLDNTDKFMEEIVNNKNFVLVEVKDYLNGHPDNKDYKAIHIRVKYDNLPCEIVIMDDDMIKYTISTHKEYKKRTYHGD